MGCKECEKNNKGQNGIAYYRYKNANIGLLGCSPHIKEVIEILNENQESKKDV